MMARQFNEQQHLEAIEVAYMAAIKESTPGLAIKAALRALVNDLTLPSDVQKFQAAVHGVALSLKDEYPIVAQELGMVHDYVDLYLQAINRGYNPSFPGSAYIKETIKLWEIILEEEALAKKLFS
jgi:hypothetical protein